MFNIILLQAEGPTLWDFFWSSWDWINTHPVHIISMIITGIVVVFLWRWARSTALGGPRGLAVGALTVVLFLIAFAVSEYAVTIFPTESVGFTNAIVHGVNEMPDPVLFGTPVPSQEAPNDQPPATQPPTGDFPKGLWLINMPPGEGVTCTLRDGPNKESTEIGQIPNGTQVRVTNWVNSNKYLGCELRGQIDAVAGFTTGYIHCSCVAGNYVGP